VVAAPEAELLRDYRPYDPERLAVRRLPGDPPNPAERENMDARVAEILDSMTVDEYFAARGGIAAQVAYIEEVVSRVDLSGARRIVEFGAGTAKVSGVLTRLPGVEEVWANDFSEPLLTELAPRVVSRIGGDLGKLTLLVGDMNRVPDLGERFDAVVCYYAVHHLAIPEHFFARLAPLLPPGGKVVCFREPAVASHASRFPGVRRAYAGMRAKRREGENENLYTVGEYSEHGEPDFAFRLLGVYTGTRFLSPVAARVAAQVAHVAYDIAYVLERTR
jgi:SAM-dependent methyltransferase